MSRKMLVATVKALKAAATEWRDVMGMSDQRLAEQIRLDHIDILFVGRPVR